MILPLVSALGKTVLGAGKKVAKGIKERSKKVDVDKFMNKKKGGKTYSRPETIPHISNTNITLSSNLSSDEVLKSNEVEDIVGDMRNVVGNIKSIIEKDFQLDRQEDKDKKTTRRNMFARAREKFLEKLPNIIKPKLKSLKNISALQKMQKFFSTVLIGSLLTFLYENMDVILQWIKGFIDIITPVVKWIVNIGKGIVKMALAIPQDMVRVDDQIDKLKETEEEALKTLTDVKMDAAKLESDLAKANERQKEKEEEATTGDDDGTTTSEQYTEVAGERFDPDNPTEEQQQAIQFKNQMAESRGEEPQKFNKGGKVAGSGNTDTVPAMLTPGEFVMSKGAVQKYGEDTLASMNAMGGGTNIPTLGRYKEGGVVTDPEERKQQEAYMLKYVNEERVLQGLEPLTNLTYAPGVELTKMRGPGPRTKETSDTITDLDRGIETTSTSKTVDGKTTFGASMRQITPEDRQKFFAENPHAAQLVNLKNQIELDNLGADISASAKMKGGGLVQGFLGLKGGGKVISNSENATMRGGQVVSGNMSQSSADYNQKKLQLQKARFQAISTYGFNSPEVNQIKKQLLILDGTPAEAIVIPKGKGEIKVKGYSTYKGSGGTGKKKGEGGGLLSNISNLFNRSSDVDEKKSSSSGILGPISSNIDDMVNTKEYKPLENISTYEEDFENEINVPIALPKSQSSFPSSQSGGMIPVPIGSSSRTLLNRYYKEQLLSFLYKV